jgi:hypothetical protein
VQVARQLGHVIARDLITGDFVGHLNFLVFPVVEPSDRDGGGSNPMTHGKVVDAGLRLELADADHLVAVRNFIGKVVKSMFAESIEIGIPRRASADIETPFASLGKDLVAGVLDGNGGFLTGGWGLREDYVE